MKPSSRFLQSAILASILQSSEALVGISWSISDPPATGLQDITFPISMSEAPHISGYYFAQQFNFKNQSDVGYTGLQPREDVESSSIIHAVFSSFINGTTSTDNNCKDGADGGAGVSCAVDIDASYEHGYHLKVNNTGGTTWSGTLIDVVTKNETHIGAYTLPEDSGGLLGTQVGFVEYYPWNSQAQHSCATLPQTEVTFGIPTTESGEAGSLEEPYEYGDCIGQVDFEASVETEDGYTIIVGFP
ncbi:hypothetical protein N7488_003598 [Penicillium malachiteum]|nr:hypothetical protein N7488_003598 [Penicillium malachiteum]